MANFSIDNFRAEVLGGGLAKANRFEVIFTAPRCVSGFNTGKVSMFAENAQLPIARVNTSTQRIFGPPTQHPQYAEYGGDNISIQFYLDREMNVKRFFDTWINGVVSKDTYTAFYQENYLSSGMSISQLDEKDTVMYRAKFEDLFPISVNPVMLDHGQSNTVSRLNVTFAYRIWRVETTGTTAAPENNSSPVNPVKRPQTTTEADRRVTFTNQENPLGGTKDNPMSFDTTSGFGA